MTKKQSVEWLVNHGVSASGHVKNNRYFIDEVDGQRFNTKQQVAAHKALLDKEIEVLDDLALKRELNRKLDNLFSNAAEFIDHICLEEPLNEED